MRELVINDEFHRVDLLLSSEKKTEIIEMNEGWWGRTLLHVAVEDDKLEMTKGLVAAGIDVNSTNFGGRTCVHFASSFGNVTSLRYLCQHFPHLLNLQDDDGTQAHLQGT